MATLQELREQIDGIDDQLVDLLNRRAELALEVKATKQKNNISVYAPDRERKILDRVLSRGQNGPFPRVTLERIFVNIVSATRSLIGEVSVAYLGTEYSIEHEAALRQFGEAVQYSPEASVESVLLKVERGDAQYGVLPARTSGGNLVTKTFDLLLESKLLVIAEVEIKEQLALFSRCTSLSEIQRVCSTAYYFSCCEQWLCANLPHAELVLQGHVMGAIKDLDAPSGTALIASQMLGERFALNVLVSGIAVEQEMGARFIVVGQKVTLPTGNDKTSLLCSVKDRAGVLRDVLRPFAERGITLLKIESRPMRNRAWEYVFFIDLTGHQVDPAVSEAIEELRGLSSYLKVLGSYPLVCHS
jgi:chorismate mutase / prephenate dehydratase